MKVANSRLAETLRSALGAAVVERAPDKLDLFSLDGKRPALVCFPETPDQVAAALRACAAADAAVAPWGGGTAMKLGNPPRRVDVVIALGRLDRVIEHDPANLTVTAQAGINLSGLQEILSRYKQFLALDPPFPQQATVGGLVAANLNGPRRMCYGSVRDLVIGMKMALITGEQIKAGGKVVKNVAGYDMCKLFTGSLGTLGVITEVTFKVAPVPESAATITAAGPLSKVARLVGEISRSSLLPAAIHILNPAVTTPLHTAPHEWTVAVWVEGFEEAVRRHLDDAREMATRVGLETAILREEPHQRLWQAIRDFPCGHDGLVFRVTIPQARLFEVMEAIQKETFDSSPLILGDAGIGTVWAKLKESGSAADAFSKFSALAQAHDGHAVLLAATPSAKEGLDVWGPAPPSLAIMRKIKQQFDPQGLLNPGRFLSGI